MAPVSCIGCSTVVGRGASYLEIVWPNPTTTTPKSLGSAPAAFLACVGSGDDERCAYREACGLECVLERAVKRCALGERIAAGIDDERLADEADALVAEIEQLLHPVRRAVVVVDNDGTNGVAQPAFNLDRRASGVEGELHLVAMRGSREDNPVHWPVEQRFNAFLALARVFAGVEQQRARAGVHGGLLRSGRDLGHERV